MNRTFLLRLEGVNLFNFVFDTRDLSTIRGSGLMLLDAVDTAESILKKEVGKANISVLSRGASSGLFEIETSDPAPTAQNVRDDLEKAFPYATFVVDVVEKSPEDVSSPNRFRSDIEALMAANRWRQMQASSLAIPPKNIAPRMMVKPACALDGLRPAVNDVEHGAPNRSTDKDAFICDAVLRRRNYGLDKKQTFYKNVVERVAGRDASPEQKRALYTFAQTLPAFAADFEKIANQSDNRLTSQNNKRLNGKLAVFYADGNNFGKKQTEHCKDPKSQMAFDEFLRSRREIFLTEFIEMAVQSNEWTMTDAGKKVIRFETLLWGGDEVMFVMPAPLGWHFAAFFFRKMGGLNLNQAKIAGGTTLADVPLTHAAALVFCQHHAPIDRIKHLAKDQMAEFAKKTDRTRDSLVAVALESFDHLGSGYETAMKKRYNGAIPLEQIILRGTPEKSLADCLSDIATHITALRQSESFARSQLRGLVSDMLAEPATADERAKFLEDDKNGKWSPPRAFRNTGEPERKLLHESLLPLFGGSPAALWIQLEELWDYALS